VFFVVFVVGAGLAALGGNGGGNLAQMNKKSGGGKDTAPKPELVVSSPSGSPTVTKDSIEVKGEVTPATSKVEVNGEGVTPSDDGSFSIPFHLNVGENYIQISAEKGSEQADASRTVTRELSEKESAAQEAPQVQTNEQQPQAEQKPTPQAEYSVGHLRKAAQSGVVPEHRPGAWERARFRVRVARTPDRTSHPHLARARSSHSTFPPQFSPPLDHI
jgi:Glucodextranase, domain B